MPEGRLARARSGNEDYVYQPPQPLPAHYHRWLALRGGSFELCLCGLSFETWQLGEKIRADLDREIPEVGYGAGV